MARVSSRQATPNRKFEGAFLYFIKQNIVPKFEIANFENVSNDCIAVIKS